MLVILLSCLTLLSAQAHAHWGNEYFSNARDARKHLTSEQRLDVFQAMVLGAHTAPAGLLRRQQDLVLTEANTVYWTEIDGHYVSDSREAVTALFLSIVEIETDQADLWNREGASKLLSEWNRLEPYANKLFKNAFSNSIILKESRNKYLEAGEPSALAWYARALKSSLKNSNSSMRFHLFGSEETANLKDLPELIYKGKDKTRVLNLFLTMVVNILEDGFAVDLERVKDLSRRDDFVSDRVRELTPIFRQLKDNPELVRAALDNRAKPALKVLAHVLEPMLQEFVAAAELDDSSPGTDWAQTTAKIYQVIESSSYYRALSSECDQLLAGPE